MRYADGLLAGGEVIIRRARQHWIALLFDSTNVLVLWALAAGAWLVGAIWLSSISAELANLLGIFALGCLLAGLLIFLLRIWEWWAQDYLVTNRRIVKVEGILNKRAADSALEKINDAILTQDIPGRIFGYGDLDILTAADIAVDRYRMLDRAPEFKRLMLDAKRALEMETEYRAPPSPPIRAGAYTTGGQQARAPGAAAPERPQRYGSSGEIMDTIGRLAELRDRGAISAEEFEAKKRELLSRL
jgi:PH (Pleckstrin Homology) domain-containing protein/putative oligomerization/nucleic acid binding protein